MKPLEQPHNVSSGSQPGCTLESPRELLKDTDAQAPPQINSASISGDGFGVLLYFLNSPGDSNVPPDFPSIDSGSKF